MADLPLVLVADDEEDVRELVCFNLEQAGFETLQAKDGLQAFAMGKERQPSIFVLDVMMPGRDGFRVCEMLREEESTRRIPILMLTARGQTDDRISGLQKGADDYMAKPFSPKELVLRVKSLLRRIEPSGQNSRLKVGPFDFDLTSVKLTVNDEPIPLTLLEFKLLHLLASKNGAVVERESILREVWGYSDLSRTRTLDTHMKRLREKLSDYSDWLQTSRGFGYLFKEPVVR